ncbi:S8 family serine peptidase, partial [Nitrolancea hollandica]|uniref:S8 family serine peptidase n=1 Tax=Nitrolancea hollandica TaxID=1206749 RepID=UPI001EE65E7F
MEIYKDERSQRVVLPPKERQKVFDGLQEVRRPSRHDKLGPRLLKEGFPSTDDFYLDVDLWRPSSTDALNLTIGMLREICSKAGGIVVEQVRTQSLLLTKIRANTNLAETLLDWSAVARVDRPPELSEAQVGLFSKVQPPDPSILPSDDDPLACVVDSGVVAGHPLLTNWVVEERDFDSGEGTTVDLNGHGTAVAGLVVYGDIAQCIEQSTWKPGVRICSAKVLRNKVNPFDHDSGEAVFPDENRIERVVEDAIRYFAQERDCRVFNLSFGVNEIYRGQRQFPLAEKLDELARELDVVVIVPAGNRNTFDLPVPDHVYTRDHLQQAVRNQMLEP